MAIVLSTQSRLLVVLCGFLVVLAGTLTIGSFTGWFKQQRSYKPTPAKLKQDTSGSISSYPPDTLHSKSRLEAPGAFRNEQNTLDAEAFRRDPGLNTVEGGIGPPSNIEDLGPQGESRSDGIDELSVYLSESGLRESGDPVDIQYNTNFNSGVLVQSVVSSHIKGEPGVPGLKGEKGEQGDIGPRGNPGAHCTPGLPGRKGEPGQTGIPGKSGKDGIKGEKGEQGLPGTVVATNRGIKTITLKGNKGEPGKRGRRGKPGPAGPPGLDGVDNLSEKIGFPRHKGEKGEHGEDGSPGQDGLPGLPGSPGSSSFTGNNDIPRHPFLPGPPGPAGPPGLPGPPGLSIIGPKGEPGGLLSLYDEEVDSSPRAELPQEEKSLNSKYISGAVTFQDRDAMVEMSNVSPMGTLAYIIEEEALLVKVNSGWQNILLGSLLQITTSAPPSTSPSQEQQPFEAGNDIHNIPQIIEGLELETSNRYQKMLRMAALNEPRTGDMHGLRGADYACYREARRAGLRGIFRAFLSSRVQNIDSIVRAVDREFPVVNLKGDVLFHSWADMFRGDGATFLHQPRIFTFKGKNILNDISWPHKATWHGALSDGQRALDISCDAWHSAAPENLGLASSLLGQRLLAQSPYTCNNKLALLCVEATSDYSDLVRKKRRTSNHSLPEDEEILSQDEYILLLEEIIGS